MTVFYIDVQTFGKDFSAFYDDCRHTIEFVRAIPGDIFKTADDRLQVVYFDPRAHEPVESVFDMVILSAGLTPSADNPDLARMFKWGLASTGFMQVRERLAEPPAGIFAAGAAQAPMSIAESISSAGSAVWQIVDYLATGRD